MIAPLTMLALALQGVLVPWMVFSLVFLRGCVNSVDYPTRQVRLLDATSYRYAGPGTAVPFTPDADLPLLRARIKPRGRRAREIRSQGSGVRS